jgi:hypothetical protein
MQKEAELVDGYGAPKHVAPETFDVFSNTQ